MEKVLVTGAAGLIGQSVLEDLRASGREIIALDRVHVEAASGSVETLIKDIRDVTPADLAGVGAVVHLAALTLSSEKTAFGQAAAPVTSAEQMLGVNVIGSDALFRAAVHAGVPTVVYASTAAVYGSPGWHTTPPGGVSIGGPFRPGSLYAHTKLMVEGLADFYGSAHATRFVGIRPTFSYGLGRLVGISGMFAQWIVDAVEGRPAHLPAPFGWSGHLQLIYVADMARAFTASVTAAQDGNRFERFAHLGSVVINSPTSQRLSMHEIAATLREQTGNDQVTVAEDDFSLQLQMPEMETSSAFEFLGVDQEFPLDEAVRDITRRLGDDEAKGVTA